MKTELVLQALDGNTLTILEGKALELKHPNKILLSGDINSVGNYLKIRNNENKRTGYLSQEVDDSRCIVEVDSDKMEIKLLLDPQDPFGAEVIGKLEFTPELAQFHINETKTFQREELIKLLRFNRRFFPDVMKYEDLLKAYQSLKISSNVDLKQNSDTRGNKGIDFQKYVNSENIPTEFILRVPIFKGQDYKSFRVEICLDVTDSSVRFWFESVELAEIIEIDKEFIFNKQLEACQDFVIIHK